MMEKEVFDFVCLDRASYGPVSLASDSGGNLFLPEGTVLVSHAGSIFQLRCSLNLRLDDFAFAAPGSAIDHNRKPIQLVKVGIRQCRFPTRRELAIYWNQKII